MVFVYKGIALVLLLLANFLMFILSASESFFFVVVCIVIALLSWSIDSCLQIDHFADRPFGFGQS